MLLDAIRNRYDSLSRSEKKVAAVVLAQPELAIDANLAALAAKAEVSEPTVVRFCRSLGCEGWHAFKLRLAQGLALAPGNAEAPAAEDRSSDLIEKICGRSITTLLDLRSGLDANAIDAALHILAKANRVELYGQGTSGIVATDAQHKFFRSGLPTVAYVDPHVHSIAASLLQKGDAVIAFSQRGHNTALLPSVQLARDSGADVVVLAPGGTPLAELATVLVPIDLHVHADAYTPISTRLAHLVVVDILAVGLALKRTPVERSRMQRAQKTLEKIGMPFDSFLQSQTDD
ncbi:MurR/RpiR family transcriptional regulator [uncultured Oxalicibacterium sp.]|uniref:MurR/RpiR family transcriptional regulator n=1 Tax=uncultured Oxalicibacterium sp. TaxID=1168540 RepID=UPI0025DCB615|nr:MurR/RpiR family transcriptional regulator [uncultured Oxalicibacterium sp.]